MTRTCPFHPAAAYPSRSARPGLERRRGVCCILSLTTRCESQAKEFTMLGAKDAVANLAVKDLKVAKDFYENTLGLTQVDAEDQELIVFKSGDSMLNVYRSQYAGTNKATAVTWAVGDDLEGVVKALKAKGVKFEHYDMPDMTRKGDVHVGGKMKVAWFKDPDGNILNIVNQ
jgi:catechol 2,3-dioxygenase-like lactoylglutathione lyase family enzyme